MWFKGKHHGRPTFLAGSFHDLPEDALMPQMNAIKIADGNNGIREGPDDILRTRYDFHGDVNFLYSIQPAKGCQPIAVQVAGGKADEQRPTLPCSTFLCLL